jgi:tetratricopeptide (TPR) repeat protein
VPLFVEELTKAVLESAGQGDRVAAVLATTSLTAQAVPATLHASLMARLDRIGAAAKEVAQIGAVLGREFSYELIQPVAERRETELQAALARLAEAGLLFCRGTPPHASYVFKHALVQDAAYSTLLRSRRQHLHARIAIVVAEQFPQLAQSQPALLAHHYSEAGDKERAAAYWYQAGLQANARFATREAVAHFTKGIGLLASLPEGDTRDKRELEFQLAFAVPLIALHGFGSEQVEACATRARELIDKGVDDRTRFLAYRFVWNSSLMRRPVPQAIALARTLMDLAQGGNDAAQLAIAHRALGFSIQIAGRLAEADKLLSNGIALSDGVPDGQFAAYGEHPGMVCRAYRAQTCCLMGFPDHAARLTEAAVEHARSRNSPFSLAWSLIVAAQTHIFRREPALAERAAREAIAVSQEHRLPQWMAFARNSLGRAFCYRGEPSEGVALQEEGMRSLHGIGSVFQTVLFRLQLAESLFELGELDRAESHLDSAFAHLKAHGEMWLAPEVHRVRLMLLRAQAAPDEVLRHPIGIGLDLARSQGARLLEIRFAACVARLWRDRGEKDRARALLDPVYGWFTEGFDTADLKEAKALLDELR